MDQHQTVWNGKVAERIINNLQKRRMAGSYENMPECPALQGGELHVLRFANKVTYFDD